MHPKFYFEKVVNNFNKQLLATPILNQLGILSSEQLRYFFSQLYYFVDVFPGYLGLLLWKTNNENVRFVVIENLVDECGGIDMVEKKNFSKMHSKLLKNFIERIDPNAPTIAEKSLHTKTLISNFDNLFLHTPLVGILSVLTSMETISTSWFYLLYTQLQERKVFSEDDLYFFKLHITLDDDHGKILQDTLIPLLNNQENLELLHHCVETVSSLWSRFYEGIGNDIDARGIS